MNALSLLHPAAMTPFPLRSGVNLSHWLSQVKDNDLACAQSLTEDDLHALRELGLDHVRVPLDEAMLWDDRHRPLPAAWKRLHNLLRWCLRLGLRAVVDLHVVRAHHFNAPVEGRTNPLWDDPAAQAHLLQLWEELGNALVGYPVGMIAWELLNEPVAPDQTQWSSLANRLVRVLRRVGGRDRVLICGSNQWQSIRTLSELELPLDDPNLILSFHFYDPFLVTHYQARWTPLHHYQGLVQYPGVPYPPAVVAAQTLPPETVPHIATGNVEWTAEVLAARLDEAVAVARHRGLRLYCGEFGCLPNVPRADRLRWYSDVTRLLRARAIPYTAWDYRGAFGLVDRETGEVDAELAALLRG